MDVNKLLLQIGFDEQSQEQSCYNLDMLQDAKNPKEFSLFIVFLIVALIQLGLVYKDYRYTQSIKIERRTEQLDILRIKKLVFICLFFQSLAYLNELIGFAFQHTRSDTQPDAFPILYYFFSLSYIGVLYTCCWQCSLIWLRLLYQTREENGFLSSLNNVFQRYPIVEVLILLFSLTTYIIYLACQKSWVGVFLTLISMVVLTLFVIVALFFSNLILSQNAIPRKSRNRVVKCITGLAVAIFARLIWSIYRLVVQEELKALHAKDWGWFIYLAIYIPIANLLPTYLMNMIYQPQAEQKKKHILIAEDA